MKKTGKIVVSILLLVVFVCFPVSAHTQSQSGILAEEYIEEYGGYYIGGESVGWSIDEGLHAGTTQIRYKFAWGVSDDVKNLARSGASKWSGLVAISESIFATGTIGTINVESSLNARFHGLDYDSNGHLTSWKIEVNLYALGEGRVTDITLAHEFGHVIGLNDLYDTINRNKLMYGNGNYRTASSPTTQDIWGAKVILGIHINHTWNYEHASYNVGGYSVHNRTCTECGGIGVQERCSIILLGGMLVCELCNAYQ